MNAQTIESLIEAFSRNTRPGIPGRNILALTPEDLATREIFRAEMEKRDLEIHIDVIGNMIGVRKGIEELPAVAVGSHLDSVSQGGKFDGPAGIIAGLAVIDFLNREGIETRHPVAVINFTNEEGTRFTPDMMGSYVFNGTATLDAIYAAPAAEDKTITVKSALREIGYLGELQVGDFPLKAFIELHIEQGRILESEGLELGLVERVQGIYWTAYHFEGEANHAGTTPMNLRKDAGYAAYKLAAYARELALEMGAPQVITCGNLDLSPNIPNIVPGAAHLVLDNRHPDAATLQATQDRLDTYAQQLADQEGLSLTLHPEVRVQPVAFSPSVIDALETAIQSQGYSYKRMVSGAGHDAQLVGMTYPSAMVFVPSRDGISHNPAEFTETHFLEKAIAVINEAVLKLAQ